MFDTIGGLSLDHSKAGQYSPRQGKTVPAHLISNPIEFDGINYGEFARI
jgi:hypothetical protein